MISLFIPDKIYKFELYEMHQQMKTTHKRLSFQLLVLLSMLSYLVSTQNMTVSSTSQYVGASVNYTIVIVGHNQPKNVSFTFSSWSFTTSNPYSTSTQVFLLGSQLSVSLFPQVIQTPVPSISSSQALTFTLTNMLNPSSLKPYLLTVSLFSNSTSIQTATANLTATLLQDYGFYPISYSSIVGRISTVSFDILCPNYIDKNTTLSLSFNPALITITFPSPSDSSYTVSQTSGTVLMTKWASVAVNFLTIMNVAIVNPQAALSYTISGTLSFKQNNITYNIQTVSSTVTLQTVSFNSLIVTSPLYYGNKAPLAVTSSCNFTQVSSANASNPAYTIVSYSSSEIQSTNTSNCVVKNSSSCTHTLMNNYSLTNFQTGIGSFNSLTLTFTSYTFYAGNYYALCKSSAVVTVQSQLITPSISLTNCSNLVSQTNSLTITIPVSSGQAGDTVYIRGFIGAVINTNVWSLTTIGSSNWYIAVINSTNIASNSSSGVNTVSIAFTYNNPTYTVASNSLTAVNIYRGTIVYASMSNTTSTSLCQTLSAKTINSSTLSSTSLLTYNAVNITLDMNMQIYDYSLTDYIVITFNSSGIQNQYPLAGSLVATTPFYKVNGVSVNSTQINSTAISLAFNSNVSLPSASSPVLKLTLGNIINPPIVGNFWLSIVTYDWSSGGSKQILTTTSLPITANSLSSAISNIYILQNYTISLTLMNANRNILSKNTSSTSSSLTITLPPQLSCSNAVNRTIIINWFIGVSTNSANAVGNTTSLGVNFGVCMFSYFTGTLSATILETFTNSSSTSTSVVMSNYCGDNCYQCSSSTTCTACFNITNNPAVFLYKGSCFSTCPNSSFLATVGTCESCHGSCGVCTGNSYLNCTSCSTYFSRTTTNYCLSICGENKYQLNGGCTSCHPNCLACLSTTDCYVCKVNATLINSVCSYASCNSPCLTCEGSQSTCTSCSSSMALYQSTCYSSCPSGTYKKNEGSGLICATVSESATYIPITIAGMIGLLGIVALRAYSNKKIGNESRRSRLYSQDDKKGANYKINILRTSAVLFAYLELIAAIVVIAKNSMYSIQTASTIIGVGLVAHLLSNICFIVGYIRLVVKKRIFNQSEDLRKEEYRQDQSKENLSLRNKIIIALSTIITFRTYKLLYSNIFIDRQAIPRQTGQQHLQQTRNPIVGPKASVPSSNLKEINRRLQGKQNRQRKLSEQSIASRKPIRSNSFDEQGNVPIPSTGAIKMTESQNDFIKLNHPFLTYLTIINVLLATGLIIIGAALEIYYSEFINMLLWGIDCLLVAIISLSLTTWDAWVFANLTKDEQRSEMSSRNGADANQTHQNLKNELEVDIKIEPPSPKASPKLSAKKSSPRDRKLSQKKVQKPPLSMEGVRSSIKRECDGDQETVERSYNIPALKVFQNFQEKEQTVRKQTKTKKFNTKNGVKKPNRNRNQSISQTKHLPIGEMCDDLYINFNQHQDREKDTFDFASKRSASPDRSLQEQTLGLEGQFQDQPPNFADISEIEIGRPEYANQTLQQDLVQGQLHGKETTQKPQK